MNSTPPKITINNNFKAATEKPVDPALEKTKLSIKNRLGRLLMITEIKNKDKKLLAEVIKAKDNLYEAFCAT